MFSLILFSNGCNDRFLSVGRCEHSHLRKVMNHMYIFLHSHPWMMSR
nr:MAG TPA: hypothetical protein [Caudoviricetes sp.]